MGIWEHKITEIQSPPGKQQLQSSSPRVRETAGSHFSHLTMLYEELESQKKLLLSSYAHGKCHVILCPHMVSSQQARYPLDEGSVCTGVFLQTSLWYAHHEAFLWICLSLALQILYGSGQKISCLHQMLCCTHAAVPPHIPASAEYRYT